MKFTQILKDRGFNVGTLANHLGLNRVALYAWNRNGVPTKHCVAIETYTFGKVTRRDLRPEDYHLHWPELNTGSVGGV